MPAEQSWVQPGEVLLHVGPHKTGTTALQTAFARCRDELIAHGVRYPGRRNSHWHAAAAFLRRRVGGGSVPDPGQWNALVAEASDPAVRTFLSSELFCEATDSDVAALAEAVGAHRLRVVLVVRSLERLLPSAWQQSVKTAGGLPYDAWLADVLDRRGSGLTWRRFDVAALVDRWVGCVGPDRVAAVVAVEQAPDHVTGEIARLLGLPPDLVAPPPVVNRSLTAAEAELIRQVFGELDGDLNARLRQRWLRRGGIHRLVEQYAPAADEPRIITPAWAVAKAREIQDEMNAGIRRSGIAVSGDLGGLVPQGQALPDGEYRPAHRIPIAAAAQLVAGILQAAARDQRSAERRLRRARRRLSKVRSGSGPPLAWHRRAGRRLRRRGRASA